MSGSGRNFWSSASGQSGGIDERVVGAARERRHAEEDVRVPQRIDVLHSDCSPMRTNPSGAVASGETNVFPPRITSWNAIATTTA